MAIPQVVILGRPNVGKSSLFNWLSGKRLAIVDDVAGVTRDRMSFPLEYEDRHFEIIDTGGIGINDIDDLSEEIEEQIALALDFADLVLFVVDTRSGVSPLDQEVARRLRAVKKPIVVVANKTDDSGFDALADEFFELGIGKEIIKVSTLQNRNQYLLLDAIVENLPEPEEEALPTEPTMKIAIVGRRNVGKSTFTNALAETERMIVSAVAGTTRDSVDVRFIVDGKPIIAIDTPGFRKRKSVKTDIEFYSTHRANRSIRRADVVLMFFDAQEEISKVDKQLCNYINENHKPCIFVVNKWDLLKDKTPTQGWSDYIHDTFPTMSHAPILFITAQDGKNVKKLINHAQMLFKQALLRVSTGVLNRVLGYALKINPPPIFRGRRPKIYYATQVASQPPTIVLFTNYPDAFSPSYRRFLIGFFRDQLDFGEIPIRLFFEKRGHDDTRDDVAEAVKKQK